MKDASQPDLSTYEEEQTVNLLNIINKALQSGEIEKAEEYCLRLRKLFPDMEAHPEFEIVKQHCSIGDYDALNRFLALYTSQIGKEGQIIYLAAGDSCLEVMEYEQALHFYQKFLRDGSYAPIEQIYLNMAYCLISLSRIDDAIVCLEKARKIIPRKTTTLHYLSLLHKAKGDMQKAHSLVMRALQIDPFNDDVRLELAKLEYSLNYVNEALLHLDMLISRQSHIVEALTLRGIIECDQGEYEHSISDLNKVLAMKSDYLPACICLARTYHQLGQHDIAERLEQGVEAINDLNTTESS
ncbi:MAG: tetratricopeptide repeat protein [Candidatus Xenobiia bacterium LiM19]